MHASYVVPVFAVHAVNRAVRTGTAVESVLEEVFQAVWSRGLELPIQVRDQLCVSIRYGTEEWPPKSGLRIHFIRIQIQHFRLNIVPIRIRILTWNTWCMVSRTPGRGVVYTYVLCCGLPSSCLYQCCSSLIWLSTCVMLAVLLALCIACRKLSF